jgi:4'-phosphopantetheinyl transferase
MRRSSLGPAVPFPKLELPRDEVHVWASALCAEVGRNDLSPALLSDDERRRSEGFTHPRDRESFIFSRLFLRSVLSRYVGLFAQDIRLLETPLGKPVLGGQRERSRLEFNLADKRGFIVLAVASGRKVGIDVAHLDSRLPWEEIAARFFSALELKLVNDLTGDKRRKSFFRLWTIKEAYLKGRGEGIGWSLGSVRLSLPKKNGWVEEDFSCRVKRPSVWEIRTFNPAPEFIGAVAAEGTGWVLRPQQDPPTMSLGDRGYQAIP